MRSRSDRDRELQLSWAHTVTLIHTDFNFRVTDSVATWPPELGLNWEANTKGGLKHV